MATKKQQSHAKRAREFALKEKRELKRAKKAARAAGDVETGDSETGDVENGDAEAADTAENAEVDTSEWIG